ncbi:MAG: DUF4091 domain-containing protein [Terriglobia bacterium]
MVSSCKYDFQSSCDMMLIKACYRNALWLIPLLSASGAIWFSARSSSSPTEDFKVWTENPMVKVQPDTPSGSSQSIELSAARNETEPFQVIISSASRKLEDVTVSVSDLQDSLGHKISSSKVVFFRQEYVYVRNPSPYSPYPPGWWPDALIPFVNPSDGKSIPNMQLVQEGTGEQKKYRLSGGRFSGSPFPVWPNRNQPVWGDIHIPKDAVAGDYSGTLTITCWACSPQSIPLKLTVWDFEIPTAPSLASYLGNLEGVASAHHIPAGSTEALALEERYATALEAHRLAAPIPAAYLPSIREDGSLDWKKSHPKLEQYMETHRTGPFRIPDFPRSTHLPKFQKLFSRYLQSYYEYLKANHWEDGVFFYPVDEPNSRETYDQVRFYGKLLHEAEPHIRLLCTEQTYPQDSSWGDLRGAVDIWCPLFSFFDPNSAAIALEHGDQLWTYTALCQKAPSFHPGFQRVGGQSTFFWEIDFPSLNFRLPFWVMWENQIQGLLYWSTVHWRNPDRDVWTDPAFRNRFNGEGYFLYPGTEVGMAGPVTSIRLKMLREGMEDLEYLKLLDKLGNHEFGVAQAMKVASSWWKWNDQPAQLYQTRAILAEKILEESHKSKARN